MKVTLFGATGKTGKYLIDEGLRRGCDITLYARSGRKFEDARIRVLQGDLTDVALLRDAVHGSDAVLSALGPTSVPHPKGLPITVATQTIISAMEQEGVHRLIAVSTGTAPDPKDGFDWKIRFPAWVIKYLMRNSYDDMLGLSKAIRASDLEWTMVRAALLKDRQASRTLNVGMYGSTEHSWTVSRSDIAAFMFDQIERPEWARKAPGISSRLI